MSKVTYKYQPFIKNKSALNVLARCVEIINTDERLMESLHHADVALCFSDSGLTVTFNTVSRFGHLLAKRYHEAMMEDYGGNSFKAAALGGAFGDREKYVCQAVPIPLHVPHDPDNDGCDDSPVEDEDAPRQNARRKK